MNNLNTARAPNIKHNSPEVKDVCIQGRLITYNVVNQILYFIETIF
jgi:hypothetical protein